MSMAASARLGLSALACAVLCACASSPEGGDCVSRYYSVVGAPTWPGLKDAMLAQTEWGHVASLRVQARGKDVGAGDQEAVRVVDLLNRNGRRLIQVDVWRAEHGAWRAGAWGQCID